MAFNPLRPFVFFDVETTGVSPRADRLVEIAAIKYQGRKEIGRFSSLINPGIPIPPEATSVHNITTEMVSGARKAEEVLPEFLQFIKGSVGAGYNVGFDIGMIKEELNRAGMAIPSEFQAVDIFQIAKARHAVGVAPGQLSLFPEFQSDLPNRKLGTVVEHYRRMKGDVGVGSSKPGAALHRAGADVEALREVWEGLNPTFKEYRLAKTGFSPRYPDIPFSRGKGWQMSLPFAGAVEEINPFTPAEFEAFIGEQSAKTATKAAVVSEGIAGKVVSKKPTGPYLLAMGTLAAGYGIYSALFSGKGNNYNNIEGLGHQGIGWQSRQALTEFGSGYQGMRVDNQIIDPAIQSFRQTWYSSPEAEARLRRKKELSTKPTGQFLPGEIISSSGKTASVKTDAYTFSWEDADTLVLNRGLFSDPIYIRLAGIDAPEISHPGDPTEWFRFNQAQPHGERSRQLAEQLAGNNLTISIANDPNAQSYGRYIGLVYNQGDPVSLNQQFVEQGIAAALPYGESGSDIISRQALMEAEERAIQSKAGMWEEEYFQRYLQVSKGIGGRLTFNTLTDLTRLSKNYHLAAMESYLRDPNIDNPWQGIQIGNKLVPSYGRFFSGSKDKYNTIEGLRHGGMAQQSRREYTDFGSGYDRVRALAKMAGQTFEEFVESKAFKTALSEGKFIKELGRGSFGRVEQFETTLMGEKFTFAKKTLQPTEEWLEELAMNPSEAYKFDIKHEMSVLKQLGHTPSVPSLYGKGNKESFFMEYMPSEEIPMGQPLSKEFFANVKETITEAAEQGIRNTDIHFGNLRLSPEGRAVWYDWGFAEITPKETPYKMIAFDMQESFNFLLESGRIPQESQAVRNLIGSSVNQPIPLEYSSTALSKSTENFGKKLLPDITHFDPMQFGKTKPLPQMDLPQRAKISLNKSSVRLQEDQRELSDLAINGGKRHLTKQGKNVNLSIRSSQVTGKY